MSTDPRRTSESEGDQSADPLPRETARLSRGASGLRHLRWSREVLATLEAHADRNATLAEADRAALRDEASALAREVQALSGAVKPYRDFLERTRVRYRGQVRAAELEVRQGGSAALLDAARAELADVEASQRAPLKAALTAAVDRLRAAMAEMDARIGERTSAALVESLYPPLARGDSRVADDGDPDDDAAAGGASEIDGPLAFVIANVDAALRRVGHIEQRSSASRRSGWGRAPSEGSASPHEVGEVLGLLEDAREAAERIRLILRDRHRSSVPEEAAAAPSARERPAAPSARGSLSSSRPQAAGAEAGAAPRKRVLIIDDEPFLARAIVGTLEPAHEAVATTSARDALDRLRAGERYDVILCDLMMPEMTGMDLYEKLAQIAPEQQRKIVFLTGGAFTERGRAFLDRVNARLLVKPFDAGALLSLVGEVIAAP